MHLTDGRGRQLLARSVPTTEADLGRFCRSLTKLTCFYLEAGTASAWAARVVEANGHRPVVVDPSRNRVIATSTKKTDRHDAAVLATMGRAGLLHPVYIRRPETDHIRRLLMTRSAMVRARGDLIRVVRAVYRAEGTPLPSAASEGFAKQLLGGAWGGVDVDKADAVVPVAECIQAITDQVKEADATIKDLAVTHKRQLQYVTSIPGVGDLIGLQFVAHIEDVGRFRNAGQVSAYLGLVPWVRESAGRRRDGNITRKGSAALRANLIQAAHVHLRYQKDSELKTWALQLAERVGKKKAIVALARKMAELMWTLWRKQRTYVPTPRPLPTPPP